MKKIQVTAGLKAVIPTTKEQVFINSTIGSQCLVTVNTNGYKKNVDKTELIVCIDKKPRRK